jgi:membrane fusion protein (multidrug efflux system)
MMSASPLADSAKSPSEGSRRRLLVLGVVVIAGLVGALLYWLHARNYESTDDAFVQADVTAISPRISGTVLSVEIEDNQQVKAGQVLVRIDPRDAEVQVAQAQASYDSAKAQLQSAQADLELTRVGGDAGIAEAEAALRSAEAEAARATADTARYQSLYAKQEVSKQLLDQASTSSRAAAAAVDQARSQLRNARAAPTQITQRQAAIAARAAQVDQAKAALDQAQLNLSYATITAPVDGKVTRKNVEVGQQVAPGAQLLAIVQNRPWVVANFKETQLAKMRIGQPVKFRIDGLAGVELTGRVDSFQSGTGSVFSLLPAENATGNFVKVVQRVPVKLIFDPPPDASHPLVPGMSVVPTVDISAAPQPASSH